MGRRTTKKLTIAAICEHLDLSKQRFYVLRREIPAFADGDDLDVIRRAYVEHLRSVAAGAKELHGKFRSGREEIDVDFERARLTREQADSKALDNAKRRGELADIDEVARLWNEMLSRLRAKMLQIPMKLMPLLAAAQSQAEAKDVLDTVVHETMTEMSRLDVSQVTDADPAADEK